MFQGHIQDQFQSGSFPPGPPPSPVRLGNTLIVSEIGNDATAMRQDQVFHFQSLEEAIIQSNFGDVIIVYPGTYFITAGLSRLGKANNIHCFPGVFLFGNLFQGLHENFQLTGAADLLIMPEDTQNIAAATDNIATNVIQCHTIQSYAYWQCYNGGNIIFDVKGDVTWELPAVGAMEIQCTGGIALNLVFKCRSIIQNQSSLSNPLSIRLLLPGSRVIFNCDVHSYGAGTIYPVAIQGNVSGEVDARIEWNGNIYQHNDTAGHYCLWIYNAFSVSGRDNGIFLNGDLVGSAGSFGAYLLAGILNHKGNILCDHAAVGVKLNCDPTDINQPSIYLHSDGKISGVTTGILYDQDVNLVQLKNSTLLCDGDAIDCPDPAVYTCLSAYSRTAVNANITNQIVTTTMIVDPLIQ